ncbi:MAG: LytTR family transcriptional regulator DNA-binding domain-containing protein [Bacteroidaceae bacterium]|nr:LytTR family transcriptional regulator DNA-binding domain-containing protein [Bacteroidaceae bacterium]
MSKEFLEILRVRMTSCFFVILALAIFKPFGLEVWQWQVYLHLANIFVMGVIICLISDSVMKYIVGMPVASDRGVGYIIRRNLWFQFINTPMIALMICLYRHFVLSHRVASNYFSIANYMETLLIIAFCSFAIGLYWRFKYRSKYLAIELEETLLLNEQLQKKQQAADVSQPEEPNDEKAEQQIITTQSSTPSTSSAFIHLSGTTNESLDLQVSDLLYIEAVGNYVKVFHLHGGKVRSDMLRATSKQMEDDLKAYPMIVRCHRAFIVNLQQVEQIVSKSGSMQLYMKYSHDSLPVSRSNLAQVKDVIKRL